MKKQTREKVALLVFALLVIFAGSVLLRYFETGRSWNVAASVVDDVFGQMQGYTVVVFDGTQDPVRKHAPTSSNKQDGETSQAASPVSMGDLVIQELEKLPVSVINRPIYASDIRSLYENKGAGVITLNVEDVERYEEPVILKAGDRSIGVVYVDYYVSQRRADALREQMTEQGADAVICLVPRATFLAKVNAFDTVIVVDDEEAVPGQSISDGSSHMIYAPLENQVGVVLLTNLNVPSSKVYSPL